MGVQEFIFEKRMTLNALFSSRTAKRSKAALVCVCVVTSVMRVAVGADRCGSLDRAANAIHMAEILYPELKGVEFSLQFSEGMGGPLSGPADVGDFLIAIDMHQWHPPGEVIHQNGGEPQGPVSGADSIEFPLYLKFGFIKAPVLAKTGTVVGRELSCQPVEFINQVGSKQMHEAWAVINVHPIYGPLQITASEFTVTGMKEPETSFALLHWLITAERVATQKTLQLMVEPFHGKIIGISQ